MAANIAGTARYQNSGGRSNKFERPLACGQNRHIALLCLRHVAPHCKSVPYRKVWQTEVQHDVVAHIAGLRCLPKHKCFAFAGPMSHCNVLHLVHRAGLQSRISKQTKTKPPVLIWPAWQIRTRPATHILPNDRDRMPFTTRGLFVS